MLKIMGSRIRKFFIDDGVSGTTFEREGFQAMIAEVDERETSQRSLLRI